MNTILIPSTGSYILTVSHEDDSHVYTTGSYPSDCIKIDKQYIREVSVEDAQQALTPGSWVHVCEWAHAHKIRYENVLKGIPEYYLDPLFVHTTWNPL
jgi:hypothetical protein